MAKPPPPWTEHALCAQTDPEAFFPETGGNASLVKQVCAACPVTSLCLEHAIITNEQYGVWGGKTRVERRQIRAARSLPNDPPEL